MTWDYIIVGQGLAGSVLSYTLLKRGCKVLVIDDAQSPKASRVAAGLFNPLTGRNLVKTWMVDTLFPFLHQFYHKLESDIDAPILHEFPIYRPFISQKEHIEWSLKADEPAYRPYIGEIIDTAGKFTGVRNPLGGIMLKNCGFVDTVVLVESMYRYLSSRQLICQERFEFPLLQLKQDHVQYRDHRARKLIFCEGPWLQKNPFFHWLPLRPVKGETLIIELEHTLPFIYNRGVFMIPLNNQMVKVGATFDHKDLEWNISFKGRSELIAKLDRVINIPYKIRNQSAGIRPATSDRRPFVGTHPEYEPLGVFNGLGTKGVSLAPYFAGEFSEYLEGGKPLTSEVTINRHFSLYYNKN